MDIHHGDPACRDGPYLRRSPADCQDNPQHPLIITHKFLQPPVERDAKAEIIPCLFNATWLATTICKNASEDVGNDKSIPGYRLHFPSVVLSALPRFVVRWYQ